MDIRRWFRFVAGTMPGGIRLVAAARRSMGPLLASIKGHRIRRTVIRAKPNVVHGLRIPFEAMTALVSCPPQIPLAVSIWGNDLTLGATRNRLAGRATRRILAKADLVFADCQRDIDLAGSWGLWPDTPTAVLPGGGGIDLAWVVEEDRALLPQVCDPAKPDQCLVVNVRGARPYVRNDTLLDALTLLAADLDPCVHVMFVDSARDRALRRSIKRHVLKNRIIVAGKCAPSEVISLLRRARVSVSITDHDGTPNSLLEAMAAGAIPVCSDLPSIREWIEPGRNGFLAAPNDPHAVADALWLALNRSDAEHGEIRLRNRRIIAERAERGYAGKRAADEYRKLLRSRNVEAFATEPRPRRV